MQTDDHSNPVLFYKGLVSWVNNRLSACFIAILFLCFAPGHIWASYNFNANCQNAYRAAWSLRSVDVKANLASEQKQNPQNLIPLYISDLEQFVRTFSSESKSDYKQYKDARYERIEALEQENENPWYNYCKAEIYIHSAILKVKYADYTGAAYDFNNAYHQLTSCMEDYPGFLPAEKDLLLLKAVVGTVPGNYKWAVKILGFSGDLKISMVKYEGLLGQMEKSADYRIFVHESRIIYAYLNYFMLNKPEEAWKQMNAATLDYASNPIDAFVRANIAIHLKKNEIAIESLTPQVTNQPVIPFLDYMMGIAKLQRGDRNAAFYFSRFIKMYKGEHYLKDAYLKLGWSFLMAGDKEHFLTAMDLVPQYGSTQLEEDKNATSEAASAPYVVPEVLRARLYFDGGYMEKALNEIKKVNPANLRKDIQKAEYYYRFARIGDGSGLDNEALLNYQVVIDRYGGLNMYFAPASCLFAGQIWEMRKNKTMARKYFEECLSYKSYVYKDSFDQKANAGLKRLE